MTKNELTILNLESYMEGVKNTVSIIIDFLHGMEQSCITNLQKEINTLKESKNENSTV